jgi:antibiotic biosynthesis monooxygenase (ABM) superfamily enzyme
VLDAPGSREYHILFTFPDRTSLRAWLDSEERLGGWPGRVSCSKLTDLVVMPVVTWVLRRWLAPRHDQQSLAGEL